MAQRANVFFERCFVSTTHLCGNVPFETIERAIIDAGVDRTILSTDLGQPETPPPAEGLRLYAERLSSTAFSVDQIRTMMQANPERLLAVWSNTRAVGTCHFSKHYKRAPRP